MRHVLAQAGQRGYRRLSLETGSMPVFAPARALYARALMAAPEGGYVLASLPNTLGGKTAEKTLAEIAGGGQEEPAAVVRKDRLVPMGDEAQHWVSRYLRDGRPVLAGERSWAMQNSGSMINSGGFYTDVASGNSFGIDDNGALTTGRNTTNVTGERLLIQPMDRLSAGLFFGAGLNEHAEIYGRGMFAKVQVQGAGASGQTPVSVNEQLTLSADNPYIPAAARELLSFDANGNALVNVERNLGLGLQYTDAVRESSQFQFGVKGVLTDSLSYDVYAQYGRTDETSTLYNNAYRLNNSGASRFAAIANSTDIFNPALDLSSFSNPLLYANRERTQSVVAATLSGDSAPLFELPAGAVSYALGYEVRKESGKQTPGDAFRNGTSFAGVSVFEMDASFDSKEWYAEVLVPLLFDHAVADQLDLEAAYRISDYSNTEAENTWKLGRNGWLSPHLPKIPTRFVLLY